MNLWVDPWRTPLHDAEADLIVQSISSQMGWPSWATLNRGIIIQERADGAFSFSGLFDVVEALLENWLRTGVALVGNVVMPQGLLEVLAECVDDYDDNSASPLFMRCKQRHIVKEYILEAIENSSLGLLYRFGCPNAIHTMTGISLQVCALWNLAVVGSLWLIELNQLRSAELRGSNARQTFNSIYRPQGSVAIMAFIVSQRTANTTMAANRDWGPTGLSEVECLRVRRSA
ncbi:hypothetical protein [Vannielia litorea]|uniref:hypothetical protein n=1 Tax=Vannielia litorea TaxID=1217970 RepID=UPI001C94773C|nr:hypothetical protein [Vannielia litorea]MBY6046702.1 hypothetical protein [Vannielia litorea]MBY6074116.1 hypothetical protein [Vannielia litorea]